MAQRLLTRTHFTKRRIENQGWQWFWTTKTPDEQDNVAVGGEGYDHVDGALNGFFSSQGDIDWKTGDPISPSYVRQRIAGDHFVICKFTEVTDDENGNDEENENGNDEEKEKEK